jgi:hypothetical protein
VSKLKLLGLIELGAKLSILGSIYYAVFTVNHMTGVLAVGSHLVYELVGILHDIEARRVAEENYQNFMDKLTNPTSGHC